MSAHIKISLLTTLATIVKLREAKSSKKEPSILGGDFLLGFQVLAKCFRDSFDSVETTLEL